MLDEMMKLDDGLSGYTVLGFSFVGQHVGAYIAWKGRR